MLMSRADGASSLGQMYPIFHEKDKWALLRRYRILLNHRIVLVPPETANRKMPASDHSHDTAHRHSLFYSPISGLLERS